MIPKENELRQVLLSMLSVGDKITCIVIGDPKRNLFKYWIKDWVITEILNKKMIRARPYKVSMLKGICFKINRIDEYQSKLYLWNGKNWEPDYEKRIKKLAIALNNREHEN
jgi:hypothetical protein